MLQPKRSSEVADIKPYDYSGLNEAITTPVKQVSSFLENERLRNAAFIDSIQDDWKQMDPRDMEFLQPEMDALLQKHTESASKFNKSIAAPRNNEERQIRAELDKKALDIYRQGKFGATMNPVYDKTRAAVLQNPNLYSAATVDFYKDEKNWYGKAPLDRSLPQAEEMSNLEKATGDILMGKFEEFSSSTPMDPNTGIIKNYLVTRLYGSNAKRDELANELANDPALDPLFEQHFKDYLYRVGQLDLLENAVTPDGKAKYDEEYRDWKFRYAQKRAEDLNKTDRKLIGTQVIDLRAQREEEARMRLLASGGAAVEEEGAHNFYNSLFAITAGDPDKFTKQSIAGADGKAQKVYKNENGVPYLISTGLKGTEIGEDATIEGWLLDQQTGEVRMLRATGEGIAKTIEDVPVKDAYRDVGYVVQSQLPAGEKKIWEKYVQDRFAMNDGSVNLSVNRDEEIIKGITERRSLVTLKGAQTFNKLQSFMEAVNSYGNNSADKDKIITDGISVDFVSGTKSTPKVYYGAKVKVAKGGFWDVNQLEFQIIDSNGRVIEGMDNLTKDELLGKLTTSIVTLDKIEGDKDEEPPVPPKKEETPPLEVTIPSDLPLPSGR